MALHCWQELRQLRHPWYETNQACAHSTRIMLTAPQRLSTLSTFTWVTAQSCSSRRSRRLFCSWFTGFGPNDGSLDIHRCQSKARTHLTQVYCMYSSCSPTDRQVLGNETLTRLARNRTLCINLYSRPSAAADCNQPRNGAGRATSNTCVSQVTKSRLSSVSIIRNSLTLA
jgi:hypothetical protein